MYNRTTISYSCHIM